MPIAGGQAISDSPDLDVTKSLVVMIDDELNGDHKQGAGIVFGLKDGWAYVVTAYHVVRKGDERATNFKVRFWQNQYEAFSAEHNGSFSLVDDLAVLRVKAPQGDFPFNRVADTGALRKSELVYAIGHPNSQPFWYVTFLPGAITDVGTSRLKVDYPSVTGGQSGGALIDERKLITGMVLDTNGTTVTALRIDRVLEILRGFEPKLPVQLVSPMGPDHTPKDFRSDLVSVVGLAKTRRLTVLQGEAISPQGNQWKSTLVIPEAKMCLLYTPMGLPQSRAFLCIFPSDQVSFRSLLSESKSALPEITWGNVDKKDAAGEAVVGNYKSLPFIRIAGDAARGIVSLYVFEQ